MRTILIHLNVELPDDAEPTVDQIADFILATAAAPEAEIVCALAEEV